MTNNDFRRIERFWKAVFKVVGRIAECVATFVLYPFLHWAAKEESEDFEKYMRNKGL